MTMTGCCEQDVPFELTVTGQVPLWLKGSYVRNGPGIFAPEMKHLFDGYGMLARFEFRDGKVSTIQRYSLTNHVGFACAKSSVQA